MLQPFVSRVLGPHNIGIHSSAQSFSQIFSTLSMMGIGLYGVKVIASNRTNKVIKWERFNSIYIIQIVLNIIFIFLYIVFVYSFIKNNIRIYYLYLFFLIANIFDVSWYFAGEENFSVILKRNLFIKITSLVFVLLFVNDQNDLVLYVFILGLATLVGNIIINAPVIIQGIKSFTRNCIFYLKLDFKGILSLGVPLICVAIYSTYDKFFLSFTNQLKIVAYYTQAFAILTFLLPFLNSISTVLMPKYANIFSHTGDRILLANKILGLLKILILISIPMSFGLALVSKEIILLLFGSEFLPSYKYLIIISSVIAIQSFNNTIISQFLIPGNLNTIYVKSTVFSALSSVFTIFVLRSFLKDFTGPIAYLFAQVCMLFFIIYSTKKYFSYSQLYRYLVKTVTISTSFFLIADFITKNISSLLLSLVLKILISFSIYLITMYLIDKSFKELVMKIYNKIKVFSIFFDRNR